MTDFGRSRRHDPFLPGAPHMSDNLLLTSLWLVPLIGAGAVLLVPRGADRTVKYVATAFTAAAFALALVALLAYVGDDRARAPLAERAARNVVTYHRGEVAVDEAQGESDLVVRRAWIPAFNIQYYLGLDGVSVGLVVLTGLWGAMFDGLIALTGLALGVAVAASSGKQAFDAIVQRDAPEADRGRLFARFEARFQVAWVIGALVPVAIELSISTGAAVVAVLAGIAIVGAVTGGFGQRSWPPSSKKSGTSMSPTPSTST